MSEKKTFLKQFLRLSLPFSLQFLLASAVNLADVVMIGQLGEKQIAAAGAANQIFFLLTIVQFGIGSGASVFMAQYWGAQRIADMRKTLGLVYMLSGLISASFTLVALLFPKQLIGFYIHDTGAIELGAQYLSIVSWTYLMTAITTSLATMCRCSNEVFLPTLASLLSMATNIIGNAVLIFGLIGFPKLGLVGAAIATFMARLLELCWLAFGVYRTRMAGAASIAELFAFHKDFVYQFLKKTLPVVFNEGAWSLGTSIGLAIIGLLGTEVVASTQIASAIAQIGFVFVRGAGNAVAVMLGNTIGENQVEKALQNAKRFLLLLPLIGLTVSILLIWAMPLALKLYNLSNQTEQLTILMIQLNALLFIPKAFSVVLIVGILRSGGDTNYACLLDILPVWLFSIPLGYALVSLQAPIWLIFLVINGEDILKPIWGIHRVFSGKWLHNLVQEHM
ncbi:Na+-driven multidrug efflux pump [Streptococcus sanguinis]|uniref:Na+-driven multidrug efflux pump n=1 Tax=Streptococcus sanguinis TaxID=1305 RepID=A0A2X3XGE0_STRSA|nr:Na+-driven multidrug efflux pump [Streptococcus sanguinis]